MSSNPHYLPVLPIKRLWSAFAFVRTCLRGGVCNSPLIHLVTHFGLTAPTEVWPAYRAYLYPISIYYRSPNASSFLHFIIARLDRGKCPDGIVPCTLFVTIIVINTCRTSNRNKLSFAFHHNFNKRIILFSLDVLCRVDWARRSCVSVCIWYEWNGSALLLQWASSQVAQYTACMSCTERQ